MEKSVYDMPERTEKKNLDLFEFNFIGLTILLYLFRTSIPFFKFPFLILFFCLIIYSLINYRKLNRLNIKLLFSDYYVLLILAFILTASFLLTPKIYLSVFKDVANVVILFSLFIILSLFIKSKNDLNLLGISLVKLIIIFALIISLNNLFYLLNSGYGYQVFSSNEKPLNIVTKPADIDYNFALLPIIFGIIGLIYILDKAKSIIENIVFNILLVINSICIFFSGSRRGAFILVVIIILLILSQIFKIIKKKSVPGRIGSASFYYLISLVILIISAWFTVYHTSYTFKNKTLRFIGSKNIETAKKNITNSIFRYTLIRNKHKTVTDLYNIIWTPVFDPRDPDSGWGTRVHKVVFPLTGTNVEIVPANSKGYLMDSTCNVSDWDGSAYSFTYIGRQIKANDKNIIRASVYCYVSKNFNGSWVRLIRGATTLDKVNGNDYDLLKKGSWQKLNLEVKSDTEVDILLYFSKQGETNFVNLRGYVIFAYPRIEIIERNDSLMSNLDYNKINIEGSFAKLKHKKNISINGNTNKHVIPFRNTKITTYSDTGISTLNQYSEAGIFKSLVSLFSQLETTDRDAIRTLAAKIVHEDTTYYGYKSELFVDTISNKFIEYRVLGFEFALQIFLKEFSWSERMFGGGFNFLNWYGYFFKKDKTQTDYPHNPFLYILLYSGIIGLVLYVFLLQRVFYYYIKYRNEFGLLFIFFIITFFFCFFSSGNPFDPPIMGFFVILPFFIHSVHKKDRGEPESNQ